VVGVDGRGVRAVLQTAQIAVIVGFAEEAGLAIVAPLEDMLGNAGKFDER
jgi:hypothetical protein